MAWYEWVPGWGSMLGSVAVAVVAWVTLDPLIENLEIKQQNQELASENKVLADEGDEVKRQLNVLQAQKESQIARLKVFETQISSTQSLLAAVNGQIKQRREDLKEANSRIGTMQNQLITLAHQINKQVEERQMFKEENARLAGENERSAEALKTQQQRLSAVHLELRKVSDERDSVLNSQKLYIVETLVIKVKAGLEPDLDRKLVSNLMSIEIFKKFSDFGSNLDEIDAGKNLNELPFASKITGRESVVSFFDSREFDLLPVVRREKLQAEIRIYMDKKEEIFDLNLAAPIDSLKRYETALRQLVELQTAKKIGAKIIIDGKVRVPNEVDLKNANKIELEARIFRDLEIERIKEARIDLHKALDEMLKEFRDV